MTGPDSPSKREAGTGPDPPLRPLSPLAPSIAQTELLSLGQISGEAEAQLADGPLSLHAHTRTSFYGALLPSGTPWDLARPRTWRASQVEPGPRSGPQSGARCLERTGRQGSRGAGRKASDSRGGLSPHPAEEPARGENVAAKAKLSEAAERKRCPEGRGGGDRPVQVRSQRQAEGCQEVGRLGRRTLGWLATRRHWPALFVPEAHVGVPS